MYRVLRQPEKFSKQITLIHAKTRGQVCDNCIPPGQRKMYLKKTNYRQPKDSSIHTCRNYGKSLEVKLAEGELLLLNVIKVEQETQKSKEIKQLQENVPEHSEKGDILRKVEIDDLIINKSTMVIEKNPRLNCELCHLLQKKTINIPCKHAISCEYCAVTIDTCKEWNIKVEEVLYLN